MGLCSGKNLPEDLDDLTNNHEHIVGYHNGIAIKELCTCGGECSHSKSDHRNCVSDLCAYSTSNVYQISSDEYQNVLFI